MVTRKDFLIDTLGESKITSPLDKDDKEKHFVCDSSRILYDDRVESLPKTCDAGDAAPSFEAAGPRKKIFFDPSKTRCAIVTCGGLCPGINDVIRGLVMELHYNYNIKNIYGIRYGYQGFIPEYGHDVFDLTPDSVAEIHKWGGTILASSRGEQDTARIVDCLEQMSVSVLFVIGGDGTLRGGMAIAGEVKKRGLKLSVVGIPKTIDNDIMFIDKSFGFETAFSEAVKSISSAHTEAKGAPNGIGLVKLMGRHSGFIACYAALAMNDVNFVLIPEVPFTLEGEHGLLKALEERLTNRSHAVIVVAEGAGQDLIEAAATGTDASGNVKLKDIGFFLKHKILEHFKTKGDIDTTVKYIDPSYLIRSIPATPQDSVFCLRLATIAAHAAMAGKTSMVVGRWHGRFVHIPMHLCAAGRKQVDPGSDLWHSVLEATGQPSEFK